MPARAASSAEISLRDLFSRQRHGAACGRGGSGWLGGGVGNARHLSGFASKNKYQPNHRSTPSIGPGVDDPQPQVIVAQGLGHEDCPASWEARDRRCSATAGGLLHRMWFCKGACYEIAACGRDSERREGLMLLN